MCVGLAGEAEAGVRRRERTRRQGREAWLKGLKVVRKVVMVWIGMDMLAVVVVVVFVTVEGGRIERCSCTEKWVDRSETEMMVLD